MFNILKEILLFAAALSVSLSVRAQQLVTDDATPEAQLVFSILAEMSGKATVSGTTARVDWNTDEAMNVYNWTGHMPALNCYDFINIHASRDVNANGWLDYSDMSVVDGWWNAGGLVSCMWHWQVKANNGVDMTCSPGMGQSETAFDPRCIYYTSSPGYQQVIHDIDQVSNYLKRMQDLGIPVLWRPLHEASGNCCQYKGGKAWFWWGAQGPETFRNLWRFLYDRMVNHHGLRNLIWVWTSQTGDDDWYPGDDVVDIIARDNYGGSASTLAREYALLADSYPQKMVTLGECGSWNETPCATFSQQWDAGCRWAWATTWYDYGYVYGSENHLHAGKTWWQDFINNPYAIDRERMYSLRQDAGMTITDRCTISDTAPDAGWNAYYDHAQKAMCYTSDWGACGWRVDKDMNRYNKLVIELAEPPAQRGTIEGDGIVNTEIIPGICRYILSLENPHVGTVLIKAATAGTRYCIKEACFARIVYGKNTATERFITVPAHDHGTYSINGKRVGDNSKGLIIRQHKKMIVR